MKSFLFILSTMCILSLSAQSPPTQSLIQAQKVKSVTTIYHPLPSIPAAGDMSDRVRTDTTGSYTKWIHWFSDEGLVDSIYLCGPMGLYQKKHYLYDAAGRIISYIEMGPNGSISKELRVEVLAEDRWRYQEYLKGNLYRETYFRADSVISYSRTHGGDQHAIYQYDFEHDISTSTRFNNDWLSHEVRMEWTFSGDQPDSLIYTFRQYAPGKGRMPSYVNRYKLAPDGSPQISNAHQGRGAGKDVSFANRFARFAGIAAAWQGFQTDELPEKSNIIETHEYTGTVHRHYYGYAYTFYP